MNNNIEIKRQNKSAIFRKFGFVIMLFMLSLSMFGQSEYDVIVNSAFSPTISDAQHKINEKANIVDTITVSKPTDYNLVTPVYVTSFTPEPIKAPRVGKDQISRLYRNFIKLGFGYNWTPYLDFEMNSIRSTKGAYGVRFFHNSFLGNLKDYAPSKYSDTKMEVYGQKFFKKYSLNVAAGYNHLLAHCYGFKPKEYDSLFNELDYKLNAKDIRRQYHHINTNVNFSNNNINSNVLNQSYTLKYDFLTDNQPNTYEHQLGLKAALNHNIKLNKLSSFNVGGKVGFNYFHNRWKNAQFRDDAMFNINPQVTFRYGEYFIKAGFDVALLPHQQKKTKKANIYPDIEVRLSIVPKVFSLYAGLDGGMKKNSYLSFVKENPYLSDVIQLGFTDEVMKIFAGTQIAILRSLSIGVRGSYGLYDGRQYFMNDTMQKIFIGDTLFSLNNTFRTEECEAWLMNLHFDLKYQYDNKLGLAFNFDFNKSWAYHSIEAGSWYKPVFVGQLDFNYLLLEKFLFNLDFYISGILHPKLKADRTVDYTPDGKIKKDKINNVFDFSFGFEYLWSKRLSFFANINNFACQRNYFYKDYPSQKLNFLVGAKYNFGGEAIGKK